MRNSSQKIFTCQECTQESLAATTKAIMAQGYDEETASNFAVLIGDTPMVDDDGMILVPHPETDEILARLPSSVLWDK